MDEIDAEFEDIKEELLMALESAANFMRGATFDPSIPRNVAEAFIKKADTIDALVERYLP